MNISVDFRFPVVTFLCDRVQMKSLGNSKKAEQRILRTDFLGLNAPGQMQEQQMNITVFFCVFVGAQEGKTCSNCLVALRNWPFLHNRSV